MASARGLSEAVRLKRAARRQSRRMEALYSHFLRPGNLCFDIGANVGDRVAVMRSVGARVVAVEPQPGCVTASARGSRAIPR